MDTDEVRAKAAELSVNFSARIMAAAVIHDGLKCVEELDPLRLAPEFEEYIRTGKVPDPIVVKKTK
jgi:hypothetical protein